MQVETVVNSQQFPLAVSLNQPLRFHHSDSLATAGIEYCLFPMLTSYRYIHPQRHSHHLSNRSFSTQIFCILHCTWSHWAVDQYSQILFNHVAEHALQSPSPQHLAGEGLCYLYRNSSTGGSTSGRTSCFCVDECTPVDATVFSRVLGS
jgi:hypothetical protein